MPRVWDLESGECTKTLEGHTHWVSSVAISPDGKTVVSGSYDKTVRWGVELCGSYVVCSVVLCCVLCCAVLCCAVLCCAVLCCGIVW